MPFLYIYWMQSESGFDINEYSGPLRAEMSPLQERKTGGEKGDCLFSLLSYLQGSHRTVGCQVQVLGQVEVIGKHGEMSCQKIVVLDSLQTEVRRKIRIFSKGFCSEEVPSVYLFSCFN